MPEGKFLPMYSGIRFCHTCGAQKKTTWPSAVVVHLGPVSDPRYDYPWPHAEGRCEKHSDLAVYPVEIS